MTAAAHITRGAKVLEIGTGSGYQAAVLAQLGATVYTIEINEGLAKRTRAVLDKLGLEQIHLEVGDGYFGWPKEAPFDAILVTAAPPRVPELLVKQLKIGGRMIIPVGVDDQDLVVLTRNPEGMRTDELMPVRFGPMIGEAQHHL
jgi:protein-L-isoaspartate(D-aspartate) O-methyltransferase